MDMTMKPKFNNIQYTYHSNLGAITKMCSYQRNYSQKRNIVQYIKSHIRMLFHNGHMHRQTRAQSYKTFRHLFRCLAQSS